MGGIGFGIVGGIRGEWGENENENDLVRAEGGEEAREGRNAGEAEGGRAGTSGGRAEGVAHGDSECSVG
jgi:hypothetical protein